MKQSEILGMKTLAYTHVGVIGIEVKGIEHGINDHALVVMCAYGCEPTAHKLRIYTTIAGKPYCRAKYHGRCFRFYFDECIRV